MHELEQARAASPDLTCDGRARYPWNTQNSSFDRRCSRSRGCDCARLETREAAEMNSRSPWLAFGVLLLAAGCSGKSSAPTEHGNPTTSLDTSTVIYVGGVTDEALLRLLSATPKNDPRQSLVIDSPVSDAPAPQETPQPFLFHPASQALGAAPALRRGPAPHMPRTGLGLFRELAHFLAPERVAHAHGAPFNGTAYLLVVADAASKTQLAVFTNQTSYVPTTDAWHSLAQAPQPLTLTIISASFDLNEIPIDGGPFVGAVSPFEIR